MQAFLKKRSDMNHYIYFSTVRYPAPKDTTKSTRHQTMHQSKPKMCWRNILVLICLLLFNFIPVSANLLNCCIKCTLCLLGPIRLHCSGVSLISAMLCHTVSARKLSQSCEHTFIRNNINNKYRAVIVFMTCTYHLLFMNLHYAKTVLSWDTKRAASVSTYWHAPNRLF